MADTHSNPFGNLLRRARQSAGLTQAGLAERAGLSERGINDLERGARQTPRKDTVALLAQALLLSEQERTVFEAAARHGTGPPPAPATFPLPTLPTGTVTFLFTDLEGSTRLLQQLGVARYAALQATHHRLLRVACAAHGGREVDSAGDGFFFAFPTAGEAVAAAAGVQQAISTEPWPAGVTVRVRMGLHTGAPVVAGEHYIGLDVHRAARIGAAGHGGQVLLSASTQVLLEPDLSHSVILRDLGTHRLKDLQRPEHLWQLVLPDVPALTDDFPPLGTLDDHPHNLPIQPTPLLGRDREVAAVCALLQGAHERLVTMTGTGGTGKTRLALQVAAELAEAFADGVWFVRLSMLVDPALVLSTIAQTLGLREAGGQPIATMLVSYLHAKHLLLLLDNFEQVVDAAPAIAELLQTCAGLKVLVTSRVPLHLRGEKQYEVHPLPLPDPAHLPPPQDLVQNPAVALFVQQAQGADATFALNNATALAIAAICTRLDGLPLAIELAAAKVRVLPPAALLMRLERQLPLLTGGARDVEARQQTMRATLAWSEDLLNPEEQRLFRSLSVFGGGFTLEAAEAVCAAPEGVEPLGLSVLEGLAALVDQSLVQRQTVGQDGADAEREEGSGEARFRLHYVVREYALERLEASGEAELVRRAHAAYYLGLVEEREFAVWGAEPGPWKAWLELEHDNFRAALAWAQELGEAELGLRLAAALGVFWYVRGYITEGRAWVEGLLALASGAAVARTGVGVADDRAQGPSGGLDVARAKSLVMASNFALVQGDDERALEAAEEGLALARSQQAGWAEGQALATLGEIMWGRGDLEQAMACLQEGVVRLRAVGEPNSAAVYLALVGALALERGDLERATACGAESLAVARREGADHPEGIALACLTHVARQRGDLARAESLGQEQVLVWRRLGDPAGLAGGLEDLAHVAAATGEGTQAERAARLLGAAASLRERVGVLRKRWWGADMDLVAAHARATLGEAEWAAAFSDGQALSVEEVIAEALGEKE
jgi:predicted ATPase/class 3 adenylate cyclase